MSGKFYMLVNPYIEGNISKIFKADNSMKAAKMIYESISKYFNNSVNNFKFTILKLKSDSVKTKNDELNAFNLGQYGGSSKNKKFSTENFSHFIVNENVGKRNEVDFTIKKYTGKIENLQTLIDNVIDIQKQLKKSIRSAKNSSDSARSESESDSINSDQEGGKKSKYDDDDGDDEDDEDDSPDYHVKKSYYYDPISYWYYYPSLYTLDRLYLPTFISPLSFPYIVDFTPVATYSNPSVNVTY